MYIGGTTRVSIRMPASVADKLQQLADMDGLTASAKLNEAIETLLRMYDFGRMPYPARMIVAGQRQLCKGEAKEAKNYRIRTMSVSKIRMCPMNLSRFACCAVLQAWGEATRKNAWADGDRTAE